LGAEFFRAQSHANFMIDGQENEKLKIGLSENNFSLSSKRKQVSERRSAATIGA
jgi:hypothetical protein